MNRFSLVALVFSVVPALARGDQPTTLPTSPPAVAMPTTVTTMPAVAVNCTPPLMQPLGVVPTVPPPIGTCVTYSEKRPGLFQSLLSCFRRPATCDTCGPTSCPTPPPIVIHVPKDCATGSCATGSCPTKSHVIARPHVVARPSANGTCWDRFKTWFCWKPCNEQLLPAFCPEPYRAPLTAYFPRCEEPTPGLPCGTCGHSKPGKKCTTPNCPTTTCATGGCPTTTSCPTAYGPVVSPWVYAGTPMPPTVASVPVAAPIPTAQPQANLLARPFTSP
ncbi:hypothetical protein [Limnoglobus roseus]|uniref:Uncharacterized protein n=1 Tax=Limnoglobus roseus TaxID=2598579 RepID=A0A5C1ADT8_9BACT|nr:hypothetical protein [Limnoglobus roseus]QEL16870.1 hypothetical protein PX52LOC_03845 [Limnoglobus roseus]